MCVDILAGFKASSARFERINHTAKYKKGMSYNNTTLKNSHMTPRT